MAGESVERDGATTPDDVKRALVAFFVRFPDASVYAATRGPARFFDTDPSPSAVDWPTFSAEVLGRGSRARLFLLTWTRCEARRRAIASNLPHPPTVGSILGFCREFGVAPATFDRTVQRAAAALAVELDRRRYL